MARNAIEYLRMIQSLLPVGKAWNRVENSVLTQFLYGNSDELVRVDLRSEDLISERDTRTTNELISEHEFDFGLPDECSEASETLTERRSNLHSRLTARGQQNKGYFIEVAAALGYTITITEYQPFLAGYSTAGSACGDLINLFTWTVNTVFGADTIYFTAGNSQAGDPLVKIPTLGPLECIINKYKPGHTVVNFNYTGPEFDEAFDMSFNSLPSEDESYLEGAFDKAFGFGFDVYLGGDFLKREFGDGFNKPS